jgi:nucleotide-binding universal stress UspA family protein
MHELSRIGVGIDFRDKTEMVLHSAARIARATGAAIDLIHVLQPPPVYDRVLVKLREVPDVDRAVAEAQASLDRLVATSVALTGIAANAHVYVGVPHIDLPAHAAELRADLLLVGPSTRHRPGWFGVGRTAGRVVRRASRPVLIAKRELAEKPRCIVATTDFSEASHPAMVEGAAWARRWNAELILVHVLEPIFHLQGWSAKIAGETDVYAVEPADLDPEWKSIVAGLELSGVRYRHEVIKGETVEAILEFAESAAADLLVVGTHGRSAVTQAVIGSSAEAILEGAACPVLVVPSSAGA